MGKLQQVLVLLFVEPSRRTMAGKPYKVGRFAHTLRVRLMREHIGVDVDAMYQEDLMQSEPVKDATELDTWDPDHEQRQGTKDGVTHDGTRKDRTAPGEAFDEMKDTVDQGKILILALHILYLKE